MTTTRNVAIVLFDHVEVLDFAGPFEVFNVAARDEPHFNVYTIAAQSPITARGGLSINPHYELSDYPQPDVLVVPGGWGTRPLLEDVAFLDWLKAQTTSLEYLLSVCTGSLLLGKIGLLDGLSATTHHGAFAELRTHAPNTTVREDLRVVDNGKVVTSGGISAGIDMALYMVAKLVSADHAHATAAYMEYRWHPEDV